MTRLRARSLSLALAVVATALGAFAVEQPARAATAAIERLEISARPIRISASAATRPVSGR